MKEIPESDMYMRTVYHSLLLGVRRHYNMALVNLVPGDVQF